MMRSRRHPDDLPRALWLAALALTIIAESSFRMPRVQAMDVIPNLDKIVHFGLFGMLATLAARIPWMQWRRPLGVYSAVFLAAFFGVTDEWHQFFTPGRGMDVWDWVADTTGAAIAVVLYVNWHTYREVLEWRIFSQEKRCVEKNLMPDVINNDGFRRSPDKDRRPAFAGRAS